MIKLTIINFGDIQTEHNLENDLRRNYTFLQTKTIIDNRLITKSSDNNVDVFEIITRLTKRRKSKGPYLVVTNYILQEYDLDLEHLIKIPGGI